MKTHLTAVNTIKQLLMLFIFTLCSTAQAHDSLKKLTTEQWQQDILQLKTQMPLKHLNLFKKMRKTDFEQAIAQLNQKLEKQPNLSHYEITVEIAKIVAMVKDGHSYVEGVYPLIDFTFSSYPIRLYHFSDGVYIRSAHKYYQQYLGAKILTINGKSIDEVIKAVSKVFPLENEMGIKAWTKYGLTSPEILHALKIIDNPNKTTFEVEQFGQKTKMNLVRGSLKPPKESFGIVTDPNWANANNSANHSTTNTLPLQLKHLDKMYWYEYDAANKLFYVQFNQVNNWGNQPVLDFFDEVVAKVSTLAVNRFVLDLRLNLGGETTLNNPIVKKLLASSKINQKGRFMLLIGRRTFSSAQLITTALEQYSHATMIGEPSGINTHFFANSRQSLTLANSQLKISLSTNWWQPTNRKDNRKWQAPDIAIERTFADYQSNHDPVMAAVLNYQEPMDLQETLTRLLAVKPMNGKALISEFRRYKNQSIYRYIDTEALINDFAYLLIEKGQMETAISFFKFNTTDYPDSANAFDSLAEAYMQTGQKQLSISHYQKSLSLDPSNTHAQAMIKKLKG